MATEREAQIESTVNRYSRTIRSGCAPAIPRPRLPDWQWRGGRSLQASGGSPVQAGRHAVEAGHGRAPAALARRGPDEAGYRPPQLRLLKGWDLQDWRITPVGDRFQGTGMRWNLETAEPLLQVQAGLLTAATRDLRHYALQAAKGMSLPYLGITPCCSPSHRKRGSAPPDHNLAHRVTS